MVFCPQCGFQGALNVPFLYHDAEFEIVFVYAPLNLGVADADQQRIIGDLTNRLMNQLPPEQRKGYLFQPRTFLSVNSLVDAVLEKDPETREAVETQRRRMELLEQLRDIDPQDGLAVAGFVGANDQELDELFFQLLAAVIGSLESQGDTVERDRLVQHQTKLMEKTTVGQVIQTQQAAVDVLSADPTRETLLEQLIAAEDRSVREVLLMVGRQLLDYVFFQTLTARIEAAKTAGDAGAQERLTALREEILDIRDQLDEMSMAFLKARADLLRDLMLAEDARALALRRLPEIDSTFFYVLRNNIREAEQEGRQDVAQNLHRVGQVVINLLNELAPPEAKFISRLLTAEDDEQVRQLLEEERERLDDELAELVEQAALDLQQEGRPERAARLQYAAEQIKALIAT
jgi:hypothetical protein